MNSRRKLLVALGGSLLTAPLGAFAQQQGKVWRVGILSNISASDRLIEAFIQGLVELGYVEGKNVLIERRFAEGNLDRLASLAADLVQQKPDVIFAPNTPSVQAVRKVAGTLPIVFATVGDPIGNGLVSSLARPGGNITGTSNIPAELGAKRLQLLKETFPKILRVAVFAGDDISLPQFTEVQRAAKILGMEVLSTQIRRRDDFEPVSVQLRKWRADSIYVVSSPSNTYNRRLLVEFSTTIRLPAIYTDKGYAEAGGLISYGPNLEALYRRAATYVDKILKGAKPADLPVEQPTKFELVINRKTAKALGLTIPQSLLISADKVIE